MWSCSPAIRAKLLTQRQLLAEVWGLRDSKSNLLRVFMTTIRRKLEPDPSHPRYFVTEPGSGLRFVPEGVVAKDRQAPGGAVPWPKGPVLRDGTCWS